MTLDWMAADWPAPEGVVAGTTLRHGDFSAMPIVGEPCWLNQVHGASVVEAGAYPVPPNADASVASKSGDICVIRTADCLPVLLCSVEGDEVAAAHAGWRGLAAGVLENTVETMRSEPETLMAWFGPAISQPSFEVGDEVLQAFAEHNPAARSCFVANDRGRWQADLYALARQRLAMAGVSDVYGGGACTYAEEASYYSYRRDPDCGRMVSFVVIQSP